MKFINRHLEIFSFFILTLAYFATRLYNILSFPIFIDEAIHIRWSQIARFDASQRFISLTDGKQPSFVWITMNIMKLVSNPLLAGRLTSVFAGFVSLIGVYFLTYELFKNKIIGFTATFLFLFYPFALVYDRMAIYDSLVTVFSILSLYLMVRLVRSQRLDIALILGMVLGGGILTKSSGFLTIYLSPVILMLFNFSQKKWINKFLKCVILVILAISLSYVYYSILRLSPFFGKIGPKNNMFIYPFNEWLTHPLRFFAEKLILLSSWVMGYMTYPILGLALISFFVNPSKNRREKILLFLWFALPLLSLALFARLLYPRYIYFMTVPLIILASYTLYFLCKRIKNIFGKTTLVILFLALPLMSDLFILNDFSHAPIPKEDLTLLINGWTAGGGVKEIISYLQTQSKKGKIFVLSTGIYGSLSTLPVEIYLGDNKNVEKMGVFPIPQNLPINIYEKAKIMPVYVFTSHPNIFDILIKGWPLKEILSYRKGTSDSYSRLYKVYIK